MCLKFHREWNIHLVKGHHEALISFETWKKIQAWLNGQAKAPVRKDINEDFPLRGFDLRLLRHTPDCVLVARQGRFICLLSVPW